MNRNDTFPSRFEEALKDKAREIADNVIYGTCQDFQEYKYQSGVVRGLDIALETFFQIIKQTSQDED
jgi:hypothetical protein